MTKNGCASCLAVAEITLRKKTTTSLPLDREVETNMETKEAIPTWRTWRYGNRARNNRDRTMARDTQVSCKRPDWPIEQTGGCDWLDLHLTTMYHLNSKTLTTGQGDFREEYSLGRSVSQSHFPHAIHRSSSSYYQHYNHKAIP